MVEMHREEPDLMLSLAHGQGNDPYDGLDRFGRTVDMRWTCCPGDSSSSGESDCESELVEQVRYGYDRASNRTHREMPIAESWGVNLDELYGYDRLHRLVDFDRGELTRDNSLIDPLARKQQWTLDATGNWSRFRDFDQTDSTAALDQTRAHNPANEITDIDETVGRIWISPTHDRSGNMLIIPKPSDPTSSCTATYDPWHRLVTIQQSDGAGGLESVAEYSCDARNFRVIKKTYTSGRLSETRHFYYSSQWQVLEERLDTSSQADRQFIWGERYIDDLVLRDRDTTNPADGLLNERLYALQDPNWNVVAIVGNSGEIHERYAYEVYGKPSILTATFTARLVSNFACQDLYAGRRLDGETELMYYRNRYYNDGLGRFVGRDPIGFGGGDANLYRYVGNGPTTNVDALGLAGVFKTIDIEGRHPQQLSIGGKNKYGEWIVWDQAVSQTEYQFYFETFFKTTDEVCCDELAFMQTNKHVDRNNNSLDIRQRAAARKTKDLWSIDRADNQYNPYYAYRDDGTAKLRTVSRGFAGVVQQKLGLDLKTIPGVHTTDAPTNDATTHDSHQYFETCVTCKKGKDKHKVYSCLQWGFDVGAGGALTPDAYAQKNSPSGHFVAAMEEWNKQAATIAGMTAIGGALIQQFKKP